MYRAREAIAQPPLLVVIMGRGLYVACSNASRHASGWNRKERWTGASRSRPMSLYRLSSPSSSSEGFPMPDGDVAVGGFRRRFIAIAITTPTTSPTTRRPPDSAYVKVMSAGGTALIVTVEACDPTAMSCEPALSNTQVKVTCCAWFGVKDTVFPATMLPSIVSQ